MNEKESGLSPNGNARSPDARRAADEGTLALRLFDSPSEVDAGQWNALLATSPTPTPFMRHEYLDALHASGSACAETGWAPLLAVLESTHRPGQWLAATPLYLKSHSYGEYVFDWAWADAYERHGLQYYPKLLGAVPFTPVPGSRLLARDAASRSALALAIRSFVAEQRLSSAHVLFCDEADKAAALEQGWMVRSTVQFHWHNREPQPYADFADFLSTLNHDKRKKIRQERRHVDGAGISFDVLRGTEIGEADWDYFHRCYTLTYRAHRSTPYLTRDFFARMAATMPDHWLMFVARRGSARVAASLVAIDPASRVAFGRYWGSTEHVPHLHFEACYYQPLNWCIAQQWHRFEGGAQGEHKMARGLLPVQTWSVHWLRDPRFADAVERFLEREGEGVAGYVNELNERSPFRKA